MAPDIYAKTAIRWLPDYAIGVQEIDQEHQGLFSIAQKLQTAIRAGGGCEVLRSLLDELVDYTYYHFAHEEELMHRISYPHYSDHRRQHEDLRAKVKTMKERLEFGETSMTHDVMHLLTDWLRCHTTTSDRRIGTYMRKCGLVI